MIKDIDALLECVSKNIQERMGAAIVGISGGADSTLIAILCQRALGKDNVYGLHLPYDEVDANTFNANSKILADKLGINQSTITIGHAVDVLATEICGLSKLNQGNMRSRIRMAALYTVCCKVAERTGQRVRVVGTDNLSEGYIGYFTKHGDGAADIFPIGSLVKSEVYQLLDYFRGQGIITEEMIDRVPSAGLWDEQTDEDELGYSYDEMEQFVLHGFNKGAESLHQFYDNQVALFVYNRHIAGKHKVEPAPVIKLREFCK